MNTRARGGHGLGDFIYTEVKQAKQPNALEAGTVVTSGEVDSRPPGQEDEPCLSCFFASIWGHVTRPGLYTAHPIFGGLVICQ